MDGLSENLRHCLKDRDAYVRKTAALCVVKMYNADPRRAEKAGFVEMLRDLMLDSNATVVANAVAALSEIGDRQDGVIFKLNLITANKLLAALGESSEYANHLLPLILRTNNTPDGDKSTFWIPSSVMFLNDIQTQKQSLSELLSSLITQTPLWF